MLNGSFSFSTLRWFDELVEDADFVDQKLLRSVGDGWEYSMSDYLIESSHIDIYLQEGRRRCR